MRGLCFLGFVFVFVRVLLHRIQSPRTLKLSERIVFFLLLSQRNQVLVICFVKKELGFPLPSPVCPGPARMALQGSVPVSVRCHADFSV